MKSGKKKNITIDKLAVMIQKGFDEAKKERLDLRKYVDIRFDKVDARFDELEGRIESYTSFWHRKFAEHEAWLQGLDKAVATIERQIKK